MKFQRTVGLWAVVVATSGPIQPLAAEEWPGWRGVSHTGVSAETGLVSSWSVEGENLIWHAPDFIGRSTPVVLDGRVCATGRVGEKQFKQEIVACWSAETGQRLWERRYNVYNTTVPFSRVGWAAADGDIETGNVYAQLVDGRFVCLDAKGETVWEHRLGEDFGRFSGYGGRTHGPLVDEDKVLISVIGGSWGEQAPPRHRYYAFDKKTGKVLWVSAPSSNPFADANTQGTPTVADIDGRRLFIGGLADGWVHAIAADTGEDVWRFRLSLAGINVTPVVDGTTVFISHSEENLDNGKMGRIVAIDGTGQGDVTATHEVWRIDDTLAGYVSPAVHGGTVYFGDNSANIYAIDAKTGERRWVHDYGTVGKASPVWADGKLYVTQVNGDVVIIEAGASEAKTLDTTHIEVEGGRHAEIYGSPAIAYGRIYLATEAGLFCIGDVSKPFELTRSQPTIGARAADPNAAPVSIQIVPAELVGMPGDTFEFEVRALDADGHFMRTVDAEWSLQGLTGELSDGILKTPAEGGGQTGKVVAQVGELRAAARLRVGPSLPTAEDFSGEKLPPHWLGTGRFRVTEYDGDRRLHKAPAERGFQRGTIYMGPESMKGYVVQADILGIRRGRRHPDIGVINGGYALELLGPHQQIRVQSWSAERRMSVAEKFEWLPATWYTVKLQVDHEDGKAIVRGRVWKKADPEPETWTIEVEDPLPIMNGSPGLTCDSGVDVYYDNVKLMEKQ
jgi:outer membrane protein assembly factor BamB